MFVRILPVMTVFVMLSLGCSSPFDFVVTVQDEKGAPILELDQEIPLYLVSSRGTFEGKYDGQGSILFTALPAVLKNELVTFEWDDSFWVPTTSSRRIPLEGDSKVLVLKPNPRLALITGLIRGDTDYLPGVTVSCCKGVSTQTDADGRYILQVPREQQQARQLITAYLEGYEFYQRFFDVREEIPSIMLIPKE